MTALDPSRSGPRRIAAHTEPGGPTLAETPNARLFQDILFGVTAVVAISGITLGSTKIPVFIVFAAIAIAFNYRRFQDVNRVAGVLFIPFLIFLAVHVGFAFRSTSANGVKIFISTAVVLSFALTLVVRYSRESAKGFLYWSGRFVFVALFLVIGWHLANGYLFSWKRLSNAKAVFDLLPLSLVVMKFSESRWTKRLFVPLAMICLVAILFSGERKAYILLAMFAPFLLNFRHPGTYLFPLILIVAIGILQTLDKSGYVHRQLLTLAAFTQGKVMDTGSNDEREALLQYAVHLFKAHPIMGVGTNYVQVVSLKEAGLRLSTHNEWLRIASENGILGLFFFTTSVVYGLVGALLPVRWGRARSIQERIIAFCFVVTLVMYVSFEAYDFVVLTATTMIVMVQFLVLDFGAAPAGRPLRRVPIRSPSPTPNP
jgi:O-antigen ligase